MKLRELEKVLCAVRYDIIEVDTKGEFMNRYKFRYSGGNPHGLRELEARVRLGAAKVLEVSSVVDSVIEITVRTPA